MTTRTMPKSETSGSQLVPEQKVKVMLCRERRDFCIALIKHRVRGCALPLSQVAPCLAQHQLPGHVSEGADVGLLIVMSAVL